MDFSTLLKKETYTRCSLPEKSTGAGILAYVGRYERSRVNFEMGSIENDNDEYKPVKKKGGLPH